MDFKELKNKKESELHNLLSENRNKLRELKFKDASKQLKNVREIREVRNTISRILTLLNAKEEVNIRTEKEKANKEDKIKE